MAKPKKATRPKLVVEVARDFDGTLYSRVRVNPFVVGELCQVVIDRKKGHLDTDTIRRRAQTLAKLLGLKYVEDLHFVCSCNSKLPCKCHP